MKLSRNIIKISYAIIIYAVCIVFCTTHAQAQESDWPRELKLDSGLLTIYQPQVDNMEKDILHFMWPRKLKSIGFLPLSSFDSLAARTVRENKSFVKSAQDSENPEEKSAVIQDSSRKILSGLETQESFSISNNIGWLLLILMGVVIVISYLIKNGIIKVKR